jgi:hypothetical protein
VTNVEGVLRRGGDVPVIDPNEAVIIGHDEPYSDSYWFAFCPRADKPVNDAFVESIRAPNEVRDPVHVCRDGGRIILLAGRRRIKGARIVWAEQAKAGVPIAKRVVVRFIMHTGSPEQLFRVNRSENADRESLTLLERALLMAHYKKQVDNLKLVAAEFQCTAQTVRNALALLECAPQVQREVEAGLPASIAVKLAKLPREKQVAALDEMIAAGATRGVAAERAVKAKAKGEEVRPVRRMRARSWLEQLRDRVLKDDEVRARDLLDYVLGDNEVLKWLPAVRAAIGRIENDRINYDGDEGAA